MHKNNFLRSWFGYSRREQAGTLVLILIIAVILVLSLLKSRNISDSENVSGIIAESASDTLNKADTSSQAPVPELKIFDPNTVSIKDLCLMGLTKKQANTLLNYRNSGAIFRKAEDFRKVYGISKELQDILIPYIIIAPKEIVRQEGKETGKLINTIRDSSERISNISESHKSAKYSSLPDFLIDLNSADSLELALLPGIGKVLSTRIIKYRNLLGGYYDIKQVKEVYGIDSTLFNRIRGSIRSDTSYINASDLNTIAYGDLLRHPYIDKESCSRIIYYRKVSGTITSLEKLMANKIISQEQALKIKPYFFCGTMPGDQK